MGRLTKEKILARGWNEEQISCFAGKGHGINSKGEIFWEGFVIKRIENFLSFKNFTTLEDHLNRIALVDKALEEKTKAGIEKIESLSVEFDTHNCLLKNKENYDPLKPIFHLVKKDFQPDENGSYSLFTDGSFKSIGSKSFASCAGWILNNETQEIVFEFSKALELNLDNVKGKGMPDFELMGITEGVKLISQLGLKNVQCYTDSSGEAKTILSAVNGIGESRYNSKDAYEQIAEILKKTNSSIGWIPRESNTHADELAKIPLNAWLEHYNKVYLEQDHIKENGYVIDREKEIYFHQDKVEIKEYSESSRYVITAWRHNLAQKEKFKAIVLYDKETDSVELLEKKDLNFYPMDESLPNEIKRIKKAKPDGSLIMNICNSMELVQDFKELSVCLGPGAIAVTKKLTPIPSVLQEEYFELHKLCNEFQGKLTFISMDKSLQKRLTKFFENEYPLLEQEQLKQEIQENKNKPKM